jgi:hypothetical protein
MEATVVTSPALKEPGSARKIATANVKNNPIQTTLDTKVSCDTINVIAVSPARVEESSACLQVALDT